MVVYWNRYFGAVILILGMAVTLVQSVAVGQEGTTQLPPEWRPYYTVRPLRGVSDQAVRRAMAQETTIPLWTYTTTSSRDGQSYTGMMVGVSPFVTPDATATIPTQLVPLRITLPDGGIFDPTAPDPCAAAPLTGTSDLALVEQSPLFLNH